jgi:Xaa-Pro aminopeptidase
MYNFKARVDKFKSLMEEKKLDYSIATPGTNFYYLSGINAFRLERLVALIIPVKSDPFIICPSFEESHFKEQTFIKEFYPWQEDENPWDLVKKLINKSNTIGIEPTTYFATFNEIKNSFPNTNFCNTEELFTDLRLHKTDEEVEAMKKAAEITEKDISEGIKNLKAGMTEDDFKKYLSGEKLVQFGQTSSYPHSEGGKNILKENDVILIDKGDKWENYQSDITRTNYYGNPPSKFFEIWHIVRQARDEAIKAAGPGVPCEMVDKAARDVIEKAGYGEYFTHRTGHGLGLDVHEPPYLVNGNKLLLEPGNVVTIEPGIYIPGEFGIRIEEDVVITENGNMVISLCPSEPEIIN